MTMHVLSLSLAALLLTGNPFALLGADVKVSEVDRRNLERGATIGGIVNGGGNDQVAVFVIAGIDASPDALIAYGRSIETLKRSSFVQAIHRFSDPPRIEDLATLVLSPRDVLAAIACSVGNCSLKLSAAEIGRLHAAASPHPERDERIQQAFRQIVLARVNTYLAGGLEALAPIVNRGAPWCLDRVFKSIVSAMPQMNDRSCAPNWLLSAPASATTVESFLYWSQETYGAGKPVVLVTHVGLIAPQQPGDPAIVIGKQVMATRYMTGGVSVTAITTDPATGRRYLIHLNRTSVDLLGGFLGSLKRSVLEARLKRELPEVIDKLRRRLQKTPSPPTP